MNYMKSPSLLGVMTVLAFGGISMASAQATNTFPDSGNVGVGTTSPSAKIHVDGGGAIVGTTGTSSNQRTLTILNSGQSQINYGSYPYDWSPALQLQNNDNTKFLWLSAGGSGSYSNYNARIYAKGGGLDFFTGNPGSELFAATIASGGNIGIGTTSPSDILSLKSSTNGAAVNVSIDSWTNGERGLVLRSNTGSSPSTRWKIGSPATTGGEPGGNIGTDFGIERFNDSGTSQGLSFFIQRGNGNVGIGTTSPAAKLDISGATYSLPATSGTTQSGLVARFKDSRTSGDVVLDIGDAANANAVWLQSTDMRNLASNYALLLNPNGGNVGVGTTSPGAKLDVNGSIYSAGQIRANALSLFMWGTDAGGVNRVLTGAPNIESQDAQGLELGTSGSTPVVLYTASAERLRIDASGNTSVTGNLNVSGSFAAKYQDVAEWVPSSGRLAAGTVVVLDSTKSNQVTSSSIAYDTRVAGVVSEQPGIALGEKGEGKVLVATTGRVRVQVDASKSPIHIGDLLVTSDVSGMAMKSEAIMIGGRQIHAPGTLIGKALEPLEKGRGSVLVLLSLQ